MQLRLDVMIVDVEHQRLRAGSRADVDRSMARRSPKVPADAAQVKGELGARPSASLAVAATAEPPEGAFASAGVGGCTSTVGQLSEAG